MLLAVTYGINEYAPLAEALASRWNRISKFKMVDLSPHMPIERFYWRPGFGKAWIWDLVDKKVDRLLWVDADAFLVRPIPPERVPNVPFAAVPDDPAVIERVVKLNPGSVELAKLTSVFHAGVFVARRDETTKAFDELKDGVHQASYGARYEHMMLNLAVSRHVGRWHKLPPEYNCMPGPGAKPGSEFDTLKIPHIYHFAGQAEKTSLRIMYGLVSAGRFRLNDRGWPRGVVEER
jgi:hypothetical protein